MATLIDEFDHFRSTSLQEAQEELDEVCQVVEVQQVEIEHLRMPYNSSTNSEIVVRRSQRIDNVERVCRFGRCDTNYNTNIS